VASVSRAGPDLAGAPLGPGAAMWRSGGASVVVVDGRAQAPAVLAGLRAATVRRVDVVIARTPARAALGTAAVLRERWPGAVVLVPRAASDLLGAHPSLHAAQTPPAGAVFVVGGLRLSVTSVAERLAIDIAPARGPPT
jgi:hypothetical protein